MKNAKYDSMNQIIELYKREGELFSVTIELTSYCNWHCEHCYFDNYTIKGFSLFQFKKLLGNLREMGVFELVITGGEVFCHPQVMDMITIAREMFFNVVIYSNISILNEEKIKRLAQLEIDYISCTVFSLDEQIHDEISQTKGALKKVLKNIELLQRYGIAVAIKTPIMRKNYYAYVELKQFCEEMNIAYKVDAQIVPKRSEYLTGSNLSLSFNQLCEIQEDIDTINGTILIDKSKNYKTCQSLEVSIYITCTGEVQPCSLYNKSLGNINSENIKDIWKSIRRRVLATYSLANSKNCSKCALINYCTQCPGIAFAESGDSTVCAQICQRTAQARKVKNETVY
ncbi:radical SAM/SPASM domain-containing protein [Lactococcus nasutitermitis]|uniref:Radical SAM/SPASM domain-containing protein n=1 Tax=Lactococcus nasutitermitis TaxID=1652957 RepID=A0ABV9JFT8_9LACT|nr:radical SAM protein [Lactococcus nasutitermitis]